MFEAMGKKSKITMLSVAALALGATAGTAGASTMSEDGGLDGCFQVTSFDYQQCGEHDECEVSTFLPAGLGNWQNENEWNDEADCDEDGPKHCDVKRDDEDEDEDTKRDDYEYQLQDLSGDEFEHADEDESCGDADECKNDDEIGDDVKKDDIQVRSIVEGPRDDQHEVKCDDETEDDSCEVKKDDESGDDLKKDEDVKVDEHQDTKDDCDTPKEDTKEDPPVKQDPPAEQPRQETPVVVTPVVEVPVQQAVVSAPVKPVVKGVKKTVKVKPVVKKPVVKKPVVKKPVVHKPVVKAAKPAPKPAPVCAVISVSRKSIDVGDATRLQVVVRMGSKAAAGAKVQLRGVGIDRVVTLGENGTATTTVKAARAGILSVSLRGTWQCATQRVGAVADVEPTLAG